MMQYEFNTGTYRFHDEPNFNYQLNRWMTFGNIPRDNIISIAAKINTREDWIREFLLLAQKFNSQGKTLQEAGALRAADFFMPYDDPQKYGIYEKLVSLFREFYKKNFDNKTIEEFSFQYKNVNLPVWRANAQGNSKGNIVITGGFDCYKEELVPVLLYFAHSGFNTYYFEGPGQGEVLLKLGIPMTHEWEKPVGAVLDRFGLDDVTMIGLSLGGYLAPRAAIYEPRIKRVVAWGVMYDFFRVVSTRRGAFLAFFIDLIIRLRLAPLLNLISKLLMKSDPYTFWGIDHGTRVMGAQTPYGFFRAIKKYTTRKISGSVKQNFLLLTGAEDHFSELWMFHKQAKKLTNVASFTGRIFMRSEHAENHCQFGNLELVLSTMVNWIELIQRKPIDNELREEIFDAMHRI